MPKLTLSINEETIQKAKRLSKRRGKSVSKIVEEYFNSIPDKKPAENPLAEIMAIMKKHKSRLKLPEDGDYKKMVNEMRYQDYLEKNKKG